PAKTSTVTVTLAKALNQVAPLKIFETKTSNNELESAQTELDYAAQVQSATPETNNVLAAPNAIFITGLNAGDKVSVYAVASGAKAIATATVVKGNTYALVTFTTTATSVYLTTTSNNELESSQLTVNLPTTSTGTSTNS
ncbi:MAG: hypothetical protein P4L41_14965, partial [Flavipsychrobacter sp.]|nr:hypothetical protein [Flavipsychrobacter sp.]